MTQNNNQGSSNNSKINSNHFDYYTHPFLDFNQLNEQMNAQGIASEHKLQFIYDAMQGEYHDMEHEIIKKPVSAIVALGSFPIEIGYIQNDNAFSHNESFVAHKTRTLKMLGKPVSLKELKSQLYRTIGMSAFMSYLNPKHASLEQLADKTLSHEHYSVLHTIQISILVCGLSSGVEHELSSQRDIVHLSRLTVAKTQAQQKPLLVLPQSKSHYLSLYTKVKHGIEDMIKESNSVSDLQLSANSNSEIGISNPTDNGKTPVARKHTDWEALNLLFPSAKASALIITGSIKNLMKLVALKDAGGKEDELIDVLLCIEHTLQKVFPEFFA
jgi:hypothetical protein